MIKVKNAIKRLIVRLKELNNAQKKTALIAVVLLVIVVAGIAIYNANHVTMPLFPRLRYEKDDVRVPKRVEAALIEGYKCAADYCNGMTSGRYSVFETSYELLEAIDNLEDEIDSLYYDYDRKEVAGIALFPPCYALSNLDARLEIIRLGVEEEYSDKGYTEDELKKKAEKEMIKEIRSSIKEDVKSVFK